MVQQVTEVIWIVGLDWREPRRLACSIRFGWWLYDIIGGSPAQFEDQARHFARAKSMIADHVADYRVKSRHGVQVEWR